MKILYYATTAFYSNPNPSFHLMYAMISDLLEGDHHVFYVGPKNLDLDKHLPEEFENHANFHFALVDCNPASKKKFPVRYLKGVKYALDSMKYIKQFMQKCDVVFLQSSPTVLYNILVAKHYAKRQKLVYNVQDMFPGSSVASGVMPYKWMQIIFYGLQKIAYRKSDIIVGISEDMRHKIIEQGVPREKTEVVLNWFDDKCVHCVPWNENRYVNKVNMSKDKFYVQYAGTMGYVFDYKIVLEVAKLLKEYKDIVIQMIGIGSQKDAFVQGAKDLKLDNIHFLPLEPQEMVSDVYSACSICYIPLKHGIIGNSVPSKAGLLMECRKAIVTSADRGSMYNEEINQNGIGIACADDDPKAVADAILRLYKNREEVRQMGENGYRYGHNLYSRTNNMKKYMEIFESMCK